MVPSRPLVSVVIPNHNYGRYVGDAIESALGQTYGSVEVIVVDNGSTDDSLHVLESFGAKIRLIAHEDRGQSEARNSGIAAVRGEFVAFLDADDVWLPGKLESQMALFRDADVGLVYCGVTRVDKSLKPLSTQLPRYEGWVLADFARGPAAVVVGGESTAVVRKRVLDQVGTFDPRLSIGTGWDLYRRIASVSRIRAVHDALTLYRQHGTNASSRMDIYAQDTLLKLQKLFDDPLSSAVQGLRRRGLSRHYLAVSGGFLEARRIGPALLYFYRAMSLWPPAALYGLALPFRGVRRALLTRLQGTPDFETLS